MAIQKEGHSALTDDNHKALWSGRFAEGPDAAAVEFETSIYVDERMAFDDIHGSMAHAKMLGEQGIISREESSQIVEGLKSIEKGSCGRKPCHRLFCGGHTFICRGNPYRPYWRGRKKTPHGKKPK